MQFLFFKKKAPHLEGDPAYWLLERVACWLEKGAADKMKGEATKWLKMEVAFWAEKGKGCHLEERAGDRVEERAFFQARTDCWMVPKASCLA